MTQLEILEKMMTIHLIPKLHFDSSKCQKGMGYTINQDGDIISIVLVNSSSFKPISDISFLEAMPNLEGLLIRGNEIKDLSPLRRLQRLKWLNLPYNNIKDVSPIETLYMPTEINLNSNKIKDFSPLMDAAIETLFLRCNKISAIPKPKAYSAKNTWLQKLYLGNNWNIKHLEHLEHFKCLTSLDLSCCNINDISFLELIPNLTYLNLEGNPISDYSPLLKLENIISVSFAVYQDYASVREMSKKLKEAVCVKTELS